jgi:hypothetical protein
MEITAAPHVIGADFQGEEAGPRFVKGPAIVNRRAMSYACGTGIAPNLATGISEPSLRQGALVFRVASWGLVNPGISIRFDTQETHKSPPHLGGNGEHFTSFPKIPNNQWT